MASVGLTASLTTSRTCRNRSSNWTDPKCRRGSSNGVRRNRASNSVVSARTGFNRYLAAENAWSTYLFAASLPASPSRLIRSSTRAIAHIPNGPKNASNLFCCQGRRTRTTPNPLSRQCGLSCTYATNARINFVQCCASIAKLSAPEGGRGTPVN